MENRNATSGREAASPPAMTPVASQPLRLLRSAAVTVAVFGLAGTAWMLDKAFRNPDVQAKKPGWFDGTFEVAFWMPLILTFLVGCAAVIAVYLTAVRRLRAGEDLYANSFRDRRWQELSRQGKAETHGTGED
jgi:hypothetical protein